MTGRAFIHIGTSKTGTTSIQRAMKQQGERLRREYSLNYPETSTNHVYIAGPFLEGGTFEPFENRILRRLATRETLTARSNRLVRDIERDAGRYRTHVLSSEQLEHLDEDAIRRVKGFFESLHLSVSIVVYIRHPAERISSLISQKVRSGRYSLETAPLDDRVLPVLKTYAGVFGKENMIVRRFGKQYWTNGSLIDDFTATVNGTPIEGMPDLRANESLSNAAVLIADQLFKIAPLVSGRRSDEGWMHAIAGPKFLAPRAMVERAVEESSECLAYLEKEFGIRFDDVDMSRFPETVSAEFTPEALASLAYLLNEQARIADEHQRLLARMQATRAPAGARPKLRAQAS
jgi:hypothetical protein